MTAKELSRWYVLVFAATAAAAAAVSLVASHLIYNATNSMPLGFYWIKPARDIRRDDVVAFRIPSNVRTLVHDRHYLPENALLLKPVVASAGDNVCTAGGVLRVNGATVGVVLEEDSAGRVLPHEDICQALARGEVFVASPHPKSFDSRTFGSIAVTAIRGTVVPLWTY